MIGKVYMEQNTSRSIGTAHIPSLKNVGAPPGCGIIDENICTV
jgi:hypothetical protein